MARGQLNWRRLSSTVRYTLRNVGRARLGDTSSGYVIIILIDRRVDRVQHPVQIDQITLGARVRHGRQVVSWSRQRRRTIATR